MFGPFIIIAAKAKVWIPDANEPLNGICNSIVWKPIATFPFTFVFMFTIHVHEPKMGRRARGVVLPYPFYGCGHEMEGGK